MPRVTMPTLQMAAGLLAACCLLSGGCTAETSATFEEARFLTVALGVSPTNLDPRVGSDEASQRVHALLYSSLVKLDRDLRVVPDLATGWETPDDRTYRVHLRSGVRFHDGRELSAQDVAYTFRSFLDPNFVSPRKGAYRLLASVTALDRDTVEFTLKEPFGSFPINLVMGIVPAGSGAELARKPVGAGPYAFVSFSADDRVVVKRFESYFGGPARNEGLILKVVPDDTMRGLELRKGTIDLIVNDLAPDIVYQLEHEGRLHVTRTPGADYSYIGLNLRDRILRDIKVRRALAYGIDRPAIVNFLRRGLAEAAVGVIPPMSWAFEPNVANFPYDPGRARQLLDEAGYRDPDGDGPRSRFVLSLKVSNSGEFPRLQAAVIQQDLRKIGVAVDVRSYEFATLYADVLRGNFQMYTLQWVGVSDPDMLRRVFHSRQMPPSGFNRGFFSDPEVDRLIDAATASTNDQQRRRLYGRAQQLVADAVPYISLWYKTNVVVSQPDIAGVRLSPIADFSFLKDVSRSRGLTADGSRE